MRFVDGPLDGRDIEVIGHRVELAGHPAMAYHRTYDPPFPPEPDWWFRGLPEPEPPEVVMEWHEREWVPPVVAAIRDAVSEAADRLDSS